MQIVISARFDRSGYSPLWETTWHRFSLTRRGSSVFMRRLGMAIRAAYPCHSLPEPNPAFVPVAQGPRSIWSPCRNRSNLGTDTLHREPI